MSAHSNIELLQVAESIARESLMPIEAVLHMLEEAMLLAAKNKYGHTEALKVVVDRKTGEVRVYREVVIVGDDEYEREMQEYGNRIVALHERDLCDGDGAARTYSEWRKSGERIDRDNNVRSDISNSVINKSHDELRDDHEIGNEAEQEQQSRYIARPMALSVAKKKDASVEVGEHMYDQLPPFNIDRETARFARHLLSTKMSQIKMEMEYNQFLEKVGEVVSGFIIERFKNGYIVKVNEVNAYIDNNQLLRSDHYKSGDRFKAYLVKVEMSTRGHRITLSRTHENFVVQLLKNEVPEIYDGIISVVKVVRDAGLRTKIAVSTSDRMIDPVGSCIGVKGSRIQPVVSELNGEKIDIVLWSPDLAQSAINSIAPIQPIKITIKENRRRIEIVVADHQQNVIIGRRGQNVKLISKLLGYSVSILTVAEDKARRQEEQGAAINLFMKQLDIDEVLAQLLISEQYMSIEDLVATSVDKMSVIPGIDREIAEEIILRAREALQNDYSKDGDDSTIDGGDSIKADNMTSLYDDVRISHKNFDNNKAMIDVYDNHVDRRKNYGNSNFSDERDYKRNKKHDSDKVGRNDRYGNIRRDESNYTEREMDKETTMWDNIRAALARGHIKKLYQVADLSRDELAEILDRSGIVMESKQLDKIILAARSKIYLGAAKDDILNSNTNRKKTNNIKNRSGVDSARSYDEVLMSINDIIAKKIRPALEDDGGNITVESFKDGIVRVRLSGACEDCPHASETLKYGVENVLRHYVPEVREVHEIITHDSMRKNNNSDIIDV